MKAIFNSRLIDLDNFSLPYNNRAFCYGDGLFETIVTGGDRINLVDKHIQRLQGACKIMQMEFPESIFNKNLIESIDLLEATNSISGDIRTKIQLWRSAGGLYAPESTSTEHLITCTSATKPFYSSAAKIGVSEKWQTQFSPISFAKRNSAIQYVLAGEEKNRRRLDEIILTDSNFNIAETHIANICWLKEDQIFTPSLDTGCIAGVMREQLLEWSTENGKPIKTGLYKNEDLLNAESIFSLNASGITWFKQFQSKSFKDPKAKLKMIIPQLPL